MDGWMDRRSGKRPEGIVRDRMMVCVWTWNVWWDTEGGGGAGYVEGREGSEDIGIGRWCVRNIWWDAEGEGGGEGGEGVVRR